METWDDAQPDPDRTVRGGSGMEDEGSAVTPDATPAAAAARAAAAEATRAAEAAEAAQGADRELPELHRALSAVADAMATPLPQSMYPKVMARAVRIRRRRRAVRAGSATAALILAAVLGPSVASRLGATHAGDASAAPPPSAIVDLTSAYPVQQADLGSTALATPTTQPANALAWPSRGAAVPSQAVELAKSYLLNHATDATTARVTTLWAQIDQDTTAPAPAAAGGKAVAAKPAAPEARKTWLYVMQGWTVAADGAPSAAELLVGDYTQSGKASASMSLYAAPVAFQHARPGSADDSDDAQQIAELSVWLPQSGRLVVMGAPQTKTVLYAPTGGDLVSQRTVDGVAVFPRTHRLVKGHYADAIQVRDANNVALTPPKAWSAADYQLTGASSLWTGDISGGGTGNGGSTGNGQWAKLPARPEPKDETSAPGAPEASPTPVPSSVVSTAR